MPRSMDQHVLPRYTFPASLGDQGSLLSILEQFQAETIIHTPDGPGKGSIFMDRT